MYMSSKFAIDLTNGFFLGSLYEIYTVTNNILGKP